VFGNGDHDTINLRNATQGTYLLDGRGSGDTYQVFYSGSGNYVVNVADSGEGGTDILAVNGTAGADNILLRASNDQSGNAFVANLHDATSTERVNYNTHIEILGVLTGEGGDTVTLDGNSAPTLIVGGSGDDHFQVGQLYQSPRDANAGIATGDIFATTLTSQGYVSDGVNYITAISGAGGNDTFTVFHNLAPLSLNGGDGDDTFTIRAFATSAGVAGVPGGISTNATTGPSLPTYLQNAQATVNGNAGADTLNVIGTEFQEGIIVNPTTVTGAGLNIAYGTIEQLNVDLAEGNDAVLVQGTAAGTATHVSGGVGNDTFYIGSLGGDGRTFTGTQTFPAGFNGIAALGGALTLDADGGAGSFIGAPHPVMLPGEHDGLASQGRVISYGVDPNGGITMTVDSSFILQTNASPQTLVGKTLDIAGGPAQGRTWIIDSAAISPAAGTLVLTLHNPTQAGVADVPTQASTFAITSHSSNYYAPLPGKDVLFGGTTITDQGPNVARAALAAASPELPAAVLKGTAPPAVKSSGSKPADMEAGLHYALDQFDGDPDAPITDDMLLKMAFQAMKYDADHPGEGAKAGSPQVDWAAQFGGDANARFSPYAKTSAKEQGGLIDMFQRYFK
jgi:hypothetical protein